MGRLAIGIFLILFGIIGLLSTRLPEWVVPAAALLAGAVVLFDRKGS